MRRRRHSDALPGGRWLLRAWCLLLLALHGEAIRQLQELELPGRELDGALSTSLLLLEEGNEAGGLGMSGEGRESRERIALVLGYMSLARRVGHGLSLIHI